MLIDLLFYCFLLTFSINHPDFLAASTFRTTTGRRSLKWA